MHNSLTRFMNAVGKRVDEFGIPNLCEQIK
jgi:hypothetical protein